MTLGEKIAKERKEQNYTQEQLAELLGVSRQSVSKWESDIAYPETDKLIRMGKLFDCSMDYLLRSEIEEKRNGGDRVNIVSEKMFTWVRAQIRERKSKKTVLGMPLYHIGRDARGFFAVGLKARGVFAVGLRAEGVVSFGLLSVGVLSIGLLSVGLAALGALALGLLAVGSVALGLFAVGAISVGIVSIGALSVGCFSAGALAIGHYGAVGDQARAMVAYGESVATGSLYSQTGVLVNGNFTQFRQTLETCVPSWLSWAKWLYLLIIG